MKKQIAVTASLFVAATAISANAATIKEDKISVSDLLDCVKDQTCAGVLLPEGEGSCPLSGLIDSLIGSGCVLPDIGNGTVDSALKDFLSGLLDRLPIGSETPDAPDAVPDAPDADLPDSDTPDCDTPDCDTPDCDTPDDGCPEIPETPVIPELPELPQMPDVPSQPEKPSEPETPSQPETPSEDNKPSNGGSNGSHESANAYINEVLALVNKYRNQNGLASVTLDSALCGAADVRAKEIKTSFSHTRPNGSSCFTVLSELGIAYNGAGENIAYGQSSPEEVMNAWMNSAGHRANILNSSFTKLGVGVYSSGGTLYWTQLFTY